MRTASLGSQSNWTGSGRSGFAKDNPSGHLVNGAKINSTYICDMKK